MQDIDFDEIDRAVSSVTNPRTPAVKVTMPAPSDPVAPTADVPVEEAPSEPVSIETSTETTENVPVTSPAVRRSNGRFMDVVHSSSDMRPAATRPQPAFIPSIPREVVTPEVIEPAETVEPTTDTPAAFHWPDPIDVQEESAPEVVSEPEEAPIAEPVGEDASGESDEAPGPLESPFLADAKVEKRPLGAFSDPDPDLLTPEDFPSSQQETSELVPTPAVEPETPQNHEEPAEVPPELHDDVLLLEATPENEPEAIQAAPTVTAEEVPVGPTSITQQYKEQPSSAGEASGAIFDTEIYNQALVHTPRSNTKVKVIVWLAVLLLIGGGIGLTVYLFVKPILG